MNLWHVWILIFGAQSMFYDKKGYAEVSIGCFCMAIFLTILANVLK